MLRGTGYINEITDNEPDAVGRNCIKELVYVNKLKNAASLFLSYATIMICKITWVKSILFCGGNRMEVALRELLTGYKLVDDIYDVIRLIDPVEKRIIAYSKSKDGLEKKSDKKGKCYGSLHRATACDNCISGRATHDRKAIVKIEYAERKIYLITAVPIQLEGGWFAVEFFKDITDTGIVEIDGKEVGEISRLVDRKNGIIVKDAFTRVFNDNYIAGHLPSEIYKAHEEKRKLALILVSISNLKYFDNLFGIQAVDGILKECSAIVKKCGRKPDDWTARYGGTDFIIVLHDVDTKQAYRTCKKMYDRLSRIEMSDKQRNAKIEFSIGFHILDGVLLSAEEFILAAGKNLYSESIGPADKRAVISLEENLPKFLLTAREVEVASLLLEGKSNSEISETLFVGLSTVKKHVSSIFDKMSVKSRSELIAKVRK